ncbi:MAG: alpha/beta hydrolase [bacterium]
MKQEPERYAVSFDDTRICFRTEGSGFPLVLCNGILCSTGYWRYVRAFFRSRATVLSWDYRSHGRSEPARSPDNLTIESLCRDLLSVLDAAGVEKAALAGHSMGVQVILEFYRRYPERVAGLIPISGTYGDPCRTFYGMEWLGSVMPPLLRVGERIAGPLARFVQPFLRSRLAIPMARASGSIHWYLCPGEVMEDYFRHLSSFDLRTAFRMGQAMAEHSAADVLARVRVPTLVIAGEKDPFTPVWVAEKMWRAIPDAELLVVPRGTHTALVEDPLLVNLRVELFLRDHFQDLGYRPVKALGDRLLRMELKRGPGLPPPASGGSRPEWNRSGAPRSRQKSTRGSMSS